MAVQITVTDSKYYSELKNGSDFTLNTGDFGTHLKGNLGERLKAELTVQIRWSMDMVSYNITGGDTVTLSSGSFYSNGFSVGDTANLSLSDGTLSDTFTILSISADGKIMVVTPFTTLGNGSYAASGADLLRGLTPLEGLKYKFNFIDGNASTNFISELDQTTLAYKADGVRTASPSAVVSTWDDTILGSQTGNHQVTFVQDVSDNGFNGTGGIDQFPLNSIQEFTIEHEFILFPYYLDGELTNLENLLRPERIEAGVSLKHIIDFEFRSTLSNPNTAKTGTYDNVLGKTSYFDENFGDEATQYSVSGLTLTSGGNPVTGVDAANTTSVAFSVINSDGVTNPFLTTDPVVAYVSKLPELFDYNTSTTNFETTWVYESLRGIVDAAPNSGSIINNLDVDLISTTQIDVSFDLTYTVGQQALIDEGDDYLIFFGVGDDALSTDLSNKSILKVNLSEYIKDQDIPGLMDVQKLEVYTHPMAFTEGVTVGYTGFKGWVQDGIMWDWAFTLDRTLDAVLERFRVRLVALKTADDTFFPLEDVEYDLSGQVVTPGPPTIQQIEIAETRNFPLADDSIFNLKTFKTGTYSAPDIPYNGQTAFKVNWQEWLSLPGADTVFYDPAEPNDGLNQKASQYSLKEGYEMRVLIDADVSVNGATVTNYIFKSPDATVLDFEEQDGTPITWTSVKETFDLSGANLNQEILTNEDTRLAFTFSPDAAPGLASLYWGIVRIEEANQPGVAICELSTLNYRPSKNNNILKPLAGDTEASLTLCVGDLCLEALVDYTMLDPAKSYNAYGRMGLVDQTPVVVPTIFKEISIDFDDNSNFAVFQQPETMANAVLTDAMFQLLDASGDIVWKSDVANLGGDRSDWVAATTYANFAALVVDLAANSNLFIYVEVNETNYPIILKEGLIIEYEIIGASVTPTNFTFSFDGNSVDMEQNRWFKQKVECALVSAPPQSRDIHYALRVAGTAGNDYVEYLGVDAVGLAAWNAAVLLLSDNVKYAMQMFLERIDNNPATYAQIDIVHSVDFLQAGSDDYEISIQAGLTTVNDQRAYLTNTGTGLPGATSFYVAADTVVSDKAANLGTARNSLFNIQNDNTWTMAFWIEMAESANPSNLVYINSTGASVTNFPQGNGVRVASTDTLIQFRFQSTFNSSNRMDRTMNFNFAKGHRYHVVITYEPLKSGATYLSTGLQYYVDGLHLTDELSNTENITTEVTDTIEPTTTTQGVNYNKPMLIQATLEDAGALGAPTVKSLSGLETLNSVHRYTLWDGVKLTGEEIYQLFKQYNAVTANLPQNASVVDDYDFADPNTGTFMVTNNGTGADAALVDGNIGNPWSTIVVDGGLVNW